METVLYITANPNDASTSYSKAVGEAFIACYQSENPNDEVVESSRRGFTAPTSHTTVRTDPYTAVQPFEYLIW
ncbi:hypothetical protein GCM10011351_28540 [Paraliobacillus quinghaiensis]|uniref:Uncharacterized protein n=1 Tax=Paraliobacillus quinghaiensis TaxID=470815 RepID=A0A917WYH2_9BACI|nr:hypothetical protein GCM10011351_28540 [Paraliobacillus quinghaiensis]